LEASQARVLLVTGSTRAGSTNTAALRTMAAVAPADDDHDPLPETVTELRRLLTWSDAVLFCTPEYAGALPGSFKNLLDWTVGGMEMYAKPVAWINVAAEGRGLAAQSSLATVLGYVGAAVIQPACVHVSVAREAVGPGGVVADTELRDRLGGVLGTIVQHVAASAAT